MIQSPFSSKSDIRKHIVDKVQLSIVDFGYDIKDKSTVAPAVIAGTEYMLQRGYGTLEVPTSAGMSEYPVYIDILRGASEYVTRCRHYGNKYGTFESRPTGDPYRIGDIIFNTDYSDQAELGWMLTTDGWLTFGHLKKWYSELEIVLSLPEPGPMQLGRQVLLREESIDTLYICRLRGTDYVWEPLGTTSGSEAQKPNNPPAGTLYFNTDKKFYEVWTGAGWVSLNPSEVDLSNYYTIDQANDKIITELNARGRGIEVVNELPPMDQRKPNMFYFKVTDKQSIIGTDHVRVSPNMGIRVDDSQ